MSLHPLRAEDENNPTAEKVIEVEAGWVSCSGGDTFCWYWRRVGEDHFRGDRFYMNKAEALAAARAALGGGRPQLQPRTFDLLNVIERNAREAPDIYTPRIVATLKLELLRQHRHDCVSKSDYFARQVELCDAEMARLSDELEEIGGYDA